MAGRAGAAKGRVASVTSEISPFDPQGQLEALRVRALDLARKLEGTNITGPDQLYDGITLALDLRRMLRAAEELKRDLLRPLLEQERPVRDAYRAIEAAINPHMNRLLEQARKVLDDYGIPVPGDIPHRYDRIVEIVDESQLPRQYLVPDRKAIYEALLQGRAIPGARMRSVCIFIAKGEKEESSD